MKVLAIAVVLLAVAPAYAAPREVVIRDNPGGYVDKFVYRIDHLRASVKIEGMCASACTMFLGYKRACVAPGAYFMFHGSYDDPNDIKGSQDAEGSAILMAHYPWALKRWIRALGGLTYHEIWIRGSDLVAIGAARQCAD